MPKRAERQNSIDRVREWMDHRYTPGYWVGGKIPPFVQNKQPRAGYAFLLPGIIVGLSAIVVLVDRRSWSQFSGVDLALLGGAIVIGAALIITVWQLVCKRKPGYISRLSYIIMALLGLLAVATVIGFRSLSSLSNQDLMDMGCMLGASAAFIIALIYLVAAGMRLLQKTSEDVYIFLEAATMGGLAGVAVLAIFSPSRLGDLARLGLISVVVLVGFVAFLAAGTMWLRKWFGEQDAEHRQD